jgi:hypothetical protein
MWESAERRNNRQKRLATTGLERAWGSESGLLGCDYRGVRASPSLEEISARSHLQYCTCGKPGRCSSAAIIEGSSITVHAVHTYTHTWVLLRRILMAESSRANFPTPRQLYFNLTDTNSTSVSSHATNNRKQTLARSRGRLWMPMDLPFSLSFSTTSSINPLPWSRLPPFSFPRSRVHTCIIRTC